MSIYSASSTSTSTLVATPQHTITKDYEAAFGVLSSSYGIGFRVHIALSSPHGIGFSVPAVKSTKATAVENVERENRRNSIFRRPAISKNYEAAFGDLSSAYGCYVNKGTKDSRRKAFGRSNVLDNVPQVPPV
ncbi:hypothetical protein BDQ17DRAFT_1382390 [Cyathus striatus]|nr:hypothetical protein BDQ17DRAFT_1382390 [Cyathus striatus]